MSNPTLERPEVLLGRQSQLPGEPLHGPIDSAFDPASRTKRPNDQLLDPRIAHELADPGVL